MTGSLTPLASQDGATTAQVFGNDSAALLYKVEGDVSLPYVDDKQIPTVGVGVNLRVFLSSYLSELHITNAAEIKAISDVVKVNYSTATSLQAALTTAIAPYGALNSLSLNTAQIADLYQQIVVGTNGKNPQGKDAMLSQFDKFLTNNQISPDLASSQEGVAIFSLYFNNADTLLPIHSHILSDLKADASGSLTNRADAWFQIRYGSNKGALTVADPTKGANGVAVRRDMESTLFGLYDPSDSSGGTVTPTLTEATSIYAELSAITNETGGTETNRDYAFAYENRYSSQVSTANTELGQLQSLQPSLSIDQLTSLSVQSLGDLLQPAANVLLEHYVSNTTLNPWVNSSLSGETIDARDVQVAAKDGNSHLVASQRASGSYALGSGDYQNSLLIAQDGADTLDGSGTADDALIGGSGNDTIIAGTGSDYIVAGTGNDSIQLNGGDDTVVLGEASNPGHAGQDSVYAQGETSANELNIYIGNGKHQSLYLGPDTNANLYYVPGEGVAPVELSIDAKQVPTSNVYRDSVTGAFLTLENQGGTSVLTVYEAGGTAHSQAAQRSLQSDVSATGDGLSLDDDPSPGDTQEGDLGSYYAGQGGNAADGLSVSLYNFSGTSGDGISLDQTTADPLPAVGSSNLGALDEFYPPDQETINHYFGDDGGHGSAFLDTIYGSNTTGGPGNVIDGFGNASFIYAGDGDNTVTALNKDIDPATGGFDNGAIASTYILGGSGNQLLIGLATGNETIQGGDQGSNASAFTSIFGETSGNAVLSLGTEDGYIFGGTGTDTLNAGADNKQNLAASGIADAVVFAGITADEVGYYFTSGIDTQTSEYQVYVDGQAYFGSELDGSDPGTNPLPGSLIIGGAGSDNLYGNTGDDTIIGGTETSISPWSSDLGSNQFVYLDNTYVGGAGSDLIIAGDGTDAIYTGMPAGVSDWQDADPLSSDTVYGGAGFDQVDGSGGNDVFYGGSGVFEVSTGNGESSVFAGSGSTLVIAGTGGVYMEGGSGTDYLEGGSGADTIFGGTGSSALWGLGGNDYLNGGGGNTNIYANIDPGDDGNWANEGAGDSVTIDGGGGNVLIYGSGGTNLIFANSGTDQIWLGNGEATVDAGSGNNDSFIAGAGDETIQLADNGQQDYLFSGTSAASINLSLQDVNSNELTLGDDGSGDLIISYGNSAIWLVGYDADGESNVTLSFDDGSTMDAGEIAYAAQQPDANVEWGQPGAADTVYANDGGSVIGNLTGNNVVYGGDGLDTIYGGTGADTIEAGSGGAYIFGGTGTETYVFDSGDGSILIAENQGAAGSDTLQFGDSLTESDVSLTRQGNDLVALVDGGAVGTVDIENYFATPGGPAHAVSDVTFADGTDLDQAQVTASLVYNNAEITGVSGTNTFGFDPYSGTNAIIQNDTTSTNVIQFTKGIDSSLVTAQEDTGSDLILTDALDGVAVTVEGYFDNAVGGVDSNFSVEFSDGSTWNSQDILAEVSGSGGGQQARGASTSNRSALEASATSNEVTDSPGQIAAQSLHDSATTPALPAVNGTVASLAAPASQPELRTSLDTSATEDLLAGTAESHASSPAGGEGQLSHPTSTEPKLGSLGAKAPLSSSTNGNPQSGRVRVDAFKALNLGISFDSDPNTRNLVGAPADPLQADRNDEINAGGKDATHDGSSRSTAPAPLETLDRTRSLGGGRVFQSTTNAAIDMAKALTATAHLLGSDGVLPGASQLQLQDGTSWFVSDVDKAMSALGGERPPKRDNHHSESMTSADMAHTQLVQAMATFNPDAAATSTIQHAMSEAYAITLAVQMH